MASGYAAVIVERAIFFPKIRTVKSVANTTNGKVNAAHVNLTPRISTGIPTNAFETVITATCRITNFISIFLSTFLKLNINPPLYRLKIIAIITDNMDKVYTRISCIYIFAYQSCAKCISTFMRDKIHLNLHSANLVKKAKEKILFRTQRQPVEAGAHGTLEYTIKKGENTGRIAKLKKLKKLTD